MQFDIVNILLRLPAVFLAMTFHEFAHALVAYKMGDPTPKNQGRLTLDPLVHVDWIGLIMFVVVGFGWAKPVQVNPYNFRNRKWGDIFVSFAGPMANIILAVISLFIFFTLILAIPQIPPVMLQIMNNIIFLNLVFAVLNMLPIPPLDGYHIVKALLNGKHSMFLFQYERYSMLVFLAFMLFGLFDVLVGVPANFLYLLLIQVGSAIAMMF